MYLFKNLITIGPEALFTISAVGYFEYLSILVIKYCSMPFSFKLVRQSLFVFGHLVQYILVEVPICGAKSLI